MTARVALLSRYVKGPRQLELKNHKRETVQDSLPPVLYHGTARYAVEFWQKAGIQSRNFSLAGDPTYAARFATYFVAEKPWPDCVATELRNSSERRILVDPMIVDQFGLQAEYELLQQGRVIQALTFFDRDMLLAGEGKHFELEWEPDWNAGLMVKHPKDYQKAFEALFAVLYYDIEAGQTEFRIFNPYLWKANFSVRPTPIGNLARFIPAKKHAEMRRRELGMYVVAKRLFLGVVLGQPEQRFLGMRNGLR